MTTLAWYRAEIARHEQQAEQWQATAAELQRENTELRARLDTFVRMHADMHAEIERLIYKDRKRLEYLYVCDPAAASVFAVLFIAYNPYTKELFALDEIYETDQAQMTVKSIGQRILDKKEQLNSRSEWRGIYDEAATWFLNEMLDSFGEHLEPSMKAANDKETGLTLIKDIMLGQKLH
jgi:hypothetical protein